MPATICRKPSVCVIGAGAAGLTIANRLANRGWQVTIVESGSLKGPRSFEGTGGVEIIGTPHRGLSEGRFRGWGGSTTRWGGQLWAWEPHEFAPRPHLGIEGWPIVAEEVLSRTGEAYDFLGLRGGALGLEEAVSLGIEPPELSPSAYRLKFSTWLPWRKRNLGRTVGKKLPSANAVRHLDTTATRIEMNAAGSRATGVRVRGDNGSEGLVESDVIVIAAGAVETIRLLFASDTASGETGGRWPWLGRAFMDHLSVRASRFRPADAGTFGAMFAPVFARSAQHTPRMLLVPSLLENERLLGCYGHWEVRSPIDSPLGLLREKLRSFQSGRPTGLSREEMRRLMTGSRDVSALLVGIVRDHRRYFERDSEIYLRIDSEQIPDPESRLVPTGKRDALGMPLLALDWRISRTEQETVSRAALLLRGEFERLNMGEFDPPADPFDPAIPWGELKGDSFHMMGGTRMSARAEYGVVDTNNKVFGVDDLFVASTSTFPTGGMANPTLLLISLTLRLADHLSSAY